MSELRERTMDIGDDCRERLCSLFPDAMEKGKINLDLLQKVLGDYAVGHYETYCFNWKGKERAAEAAKTAPVSILMPCKSESLDWDNTKNIYIEGDNLEALKVLKKSYLGTVDFIYIDPPYNTGSEFVYSDDFTHSLRNYKKLTGLTWEDDKVGAAYETNGRYHTEWLNMILPRMMACKSFLSEQGVILISIDDNEIENMRRVCNEVFSEENFVNCFIWNCATAGGIRPKFASKTHEYLLCYAKNIHNLPKFEAPLSDHAVRLYNKKDDKGIYREKDFVFKNRSTNANQKYYIICPDGQRVKPKDGYIYRFIRKTFEDALRNNTVIFKKTANGPLVDENGKQAGWNIYIKKYLGDATGAPSTLIPKEMVSIYNAGTRCLQDLFDGKRVFENSKPVNLITYFGKFLTKKDSIIMDFFSGSATTAHAVMQLNYEDNGNRRYIMVQIPEECNEKSTASQMGYKNICEIGKERIRRAAAKYRLSGIDTGFRCFKLYSPLDIALENRSNKDDIYDTMLKAGMDLAGKENANSPD